MTPEKTEFNLDSLGSKPKPYNKYFESLKSDKVESFQSIEKIREKSDEKVDSRAFTPLTLLMQNSIMIPLKAQLGLVNKAVIDNMLIEQNLFGHFRALKNYLFFGDGEFANGLCTGLFTAIRAAKSPSEILNPAVLIGITENAISSSIKVNIFFFLKKKKNSFFKQI